jgi:hypothetical protein
MVMLLTSCENASPETDAFCVKAQPIYISREDVLTDATARQILGHNLIGLKDCKWMTSE